jgi:hypothetical protein
MQGMASGGNPARTPAFPTRYAGYRFRSRTEARWAVFFDLLGLHWTYESEGYNLGDIGIYLPDFKVWTKARNDNNIARPSRAIWIEVKGDRPGVLEIEKLHRLIDGTQMDGWIMVGDPLRQPGGADALADIFGTPYGETVIAATKAREAQFEFGQSGAPTEE